MNADEKKPQLRFILNSCTVASEKSTTKSKKGFSFKEFENIKLEIKTSNIEKWMEEYRFVGFWFGCMNQSKISRVFFITVCHFHFKNVLKPTKYAVTYSCMIREMLIETHIILARIFMFMVTYPNQPYMKCMEDKRGSCWRIIFGILWLVNSYWNFVFELPWVGEWEYVSMQR